LFFRLILFERGGWLGLALPLPTGFWAASAGIIGPGGSPPFLTAPSNPPHAARF
jgi:hypothetical protein